MNPVVVTLAPIPNSAWNVCRIEINRPQRANALDLQAFDLFNTALSDAASNPEVHAVIVGGCGTRHFCAGMDLSGRNSGDDALRLRRGMRNTLTALFGFPKPVVAAVNGVAVGAGAMIVLACDRAVIAEDTYFSMPEINIGIPPLVPFELLAELLGMARAKDLVLTGKRVLPETCVALGLMTTAVPSTAVRSSAESLAAELCAKPAPSFRNFKLHVGRRMETIIDRTIGCGTREDAGSSRQRERGET